MAPICTLSNGSKMAPSSTDQYLGPLSARIEGSFFQDLESRSISRTPKWVLLILFRERERGLVRKKCIILFYWSLNWPRTCTMIGNCFFFLTDPIVILTFIWLVAWIWSSPSAALHTILLKTLKFAFIIIFQFDVWVAAMNNFEIKSKQNSSWCCCCAFIGKKLTNFNFENPNAFLFRNVN